jgi:hypothetical protein
MTRRFNWVKMRISERGPILMIFNKKTPFSSTMRRRLPLPVCARLLTLCVLIPLTLSTVALAADDLPATACDPEYMDALESRAWLEAQREITQNQNLISKPDSVLEYTCFNRFLNQMSHNFSDRLFSETDHWGAVTGITKKSTDDTLENVVRTTMNAYLTRNFQHNFLGDRLPGTDYYSTKLIEDSSTFKYPNETLPNEDPGTKNASKGATGGMDAVDKDGNVITKDPITDEKLGKDGRRRGGLEPVNGDAKFAVTDMAYDCDRMAQVWELARCVNFMQRPGKESFFDFPWYAKNDPRDLPQGFAACQSPSSLEKAGGSSENAYQQAMKSAFNAKDDDEVKLYTLDDKNDGVFADAERYKKDPVKSYLNLISPIGQNNVNSCNGMIQTGITVIRGKNEPYQEVICTNPGCAQDKGGAQSCTQE